MGLPNGKMGITMMEMLARGKSIKRLEDSDEVKEL